MVIVIFQEGQKNRVGICTGTLCPSVFIPFFGVIADRE